MFALLFDSQYNFPLKGETGSQEILKFLPFISITYSACHLVSGYIVFLIFYQS